MTAGRVPTANLNALYANTTPGTTADPAALDAAIADIVSTTNDNYDFTVGLISAGTLSRLGVINVKDYNASGSANTYVGSIAAGSNTLTLTTTSDFLAGQGINVYGNVEIASLLVTAGASSSANCTVTLNGVAFTVAVTNGDTATQVATKIRAATFTGWTTGGSGTTVTFTSTTTGTKTDASYSAGTTGATGAMTTTQQGSADLITTVSAVNGATLTLATTASTMVSGVTVAHSDTAAIQAAIDAASAGQPVIFPVGTYRLYGTGTELLLVNKPLQLIGFGMYTNLVVGSSVSSTTDVIRFSPNTSLSKELACFTGFQISAQSGTPGRHAIHFDVTNSGQYISKFTLKNNYIGALGGKGINLTNPINTDGFFTSVIEDNLIYGGTFWQRLGDSVKFERNTFTGANVGIEMTSVSGAATVVIMKNNFTSAGGALKIDSGSQVKIMYNQIEQTVAYAGTVDAMIYIGTPTMAEVHGNNLNAHSNVAHCIRINAAYRTKISKNNMIKGTAESIRVDSGSNKTDIHYDNYYVNSTDTAEIAPSILNNGVGTMGVWVPLTLVNSYTADDSANYGVPAVMKDSNGCLRFRGKLVPGTRTAGTIMFTLPVGFRTAEAWSRNVGYRNFTSAKTEIMTLIIASTGTVAVESALDTARIDIDDLVLQALY